MLNTIVAATTVCAIVLGHGGNGNVRPDTESPRSFPITDRIAEGAADPDAKPAGRTAPATVSLSALCPVVPFPAQPGDGSAVLKGSAAPWGVQVAGSFSLDRALASFDAVQRLYPAIVVGPPVVVCSIDRSLGQAPLFQIRLPAPDRQQAINICHRLETAGGACIVVRSRSGAQAGRLGMHE
jgi:hypothetical protein